MMVIHPVEASSDTGDPSRLVPVYRIALINLPLPQ